MADLGTLVATFTADLTPLNGAVSQAKSKFREFQDTGSSSFKTIAGSAVGLGDSIAMVGTRVNNTFRSMEAAVVRFQGVFLALGASAALSLGGIFAATKDYQTALVDMGKVSDLPFSAMGQQVMGLSSELGSYTELMKGYYQTMSAGIIEPVKALDLLTTASELSKVAHIEQATTVKTLAVLMGAYGDELKNTAEGASTLLNIERYGITTTAELAPEIGQIVNLAHQSGLSVNEMGAALAQLTKSGIGTAESVTQLKSLLTDVTRHFDKLPDSITKFGSVGAAIKNMGFIEFLQEITNSANGNETSLVKLMGRVEGYLALLQLTKNGAADYTNILDQMKTRTDALGTAWDNWKESLDGLWDTLKNKISNSIVQLGMSDLPILQTALEGLIVVLPTIIEAFGTLWSILSAVPKGIIDFFSNLSSQLSVTKASLDKTEQSAKEFNPPDITPWQRFMTQMSIFGQNIIYSFQLMASGVGNTLGYLASMVANTVSFIWEKLQSLSNALINLAHLKLSAAGSDVANIFSTKSLTDNMSKSADAYLKSTSAAAKTYSQAMYKNTFQRDMVVNAKVNLDKNSVANAQKQIQSIIGVKPVGASSGASSGAGAGSRVSADTISKYDKLLSDLQFEQSLLDKTTTEQRALTLARQADVKVGSDEYAQILSTVTAIDAKKQAMKEEIEATKTQIQQIKDKLAEERKANDERVKDSKEINDRLIELEQGSFAVFQNKLNEKMEMYKKAGIDTSTLTELQSQEMNNYMVNLVGGFHNTYEILETVTKQTAQALTQGFSDFFFNAMTGQFQNLMQVFLSFRDAILKMVAEMLAKILITKIAMGIGLGPLLGITGAKDGGVFSQGFVPLTAFADGGIVNRPTLGLIGEGKSPEAVIPLKHGEVPVSLKGNQDNNKPIQLNITNVADPSLMGDYLTSSNGENMVMNIIARNNYKVRKLLAGA